MTNSVRPFLPADIGAVTMLYQDTFFERRKAPSPSLMACLEDFYLSGPSADPDIPSLVHVDGRGEISGFVGINVVPMVFAGTRLRAAFCGALMVRDRASDPMAGARLLKGFLAGSQDVSLSETANKTSREMSRALKGKALAPYSLEWMKVLRPAAFGCDTALRNSPLRRFALPVARGLDGLHQWSGLGRIDKDFHRHSQGPLSVRLVDSKAFADVIGPLTSHYDLRLDWTDSQLRSVVAQAFEKPRYGQAIAALVTDTKGYPIGAFLYHLRQGGVGRVLQVLSQPGRESQIIDLMLADADGRGAAGLRGRTQPALLEAMLGKGILFANASSTVVFTRDEAIMGCFRNGQAFVNGLAGESWGPHIGGEFC
jgi:hypothetical protein